ncbi:two-component system sensor histidine kinase NtrB [Phaeobacter marinintestinus]|uniref:two-component system sensor histidine kinase NtrB n=1 Tax=Falsiphaeobacter marinintestinus TaxID=1492905 RepID=UPI0011B56375|nr:PAS domain-containing sensor histidine kinase [Phaeobacter marinintestinus]
MSVLGIIYPIAAGFAILLGAIHFLVWLRLDRRAEFFFAALMALSAATAALSEFRLLGVQTASQFQDALETLNLAIGFMLISMVWFVRLRLSAGRVWLAWAVTVIWALCMVVSLFGAGNITFQSIQGISTGLTPWGESFANPTGTLHPLKFVADMASLIIVVFVTDATIVAFRRGQRRDATVVGGSILFFIIVAGVHTPLVDAGIVQTPFLISLFFVAICVALSISLVDDVAKAASLNHSLIIEKRRWNALADGIEMAVIRTDAKGRIAYANPFVERMIGRSAEELTGSDPLDLIQDTDKQTVRRTIDQASEWKTRSEKHRKIRTASGALRDFVWFSVSLRGLDGKQDGLISIGEDITDRRKVQGELDQTRKEIEKLTRAVMLGELASTFAHELSQPIAAVLSNAQTLEIMRDRAGKPADETDEILSDILHDTRRARDLMDRVRSFMFETSPDYSEFSMPDAINEVIAMISNEADKSDVQIQAPPQDPEIIVHATKLELQQVLMNLVLNAIQSIRDAGHGPGEVKIEIEKEAGTMIVLTVDDSGSGIRQDLGHEIFAPFVTSKPTGTGIGLAVSRRIVERHNGVMKVGASPLGGARFEVRLPIAAQEIRLERA